MHYNSVAFVFRAYQVHPIENGIFSVSPHEIPDRRQYTEMYDKIELGQLRRIITCTCSASKFYCADSGGQDSPDPPSRLVAA